jgi:hypothetical protein
MIMPQKQVMCSYVNLAAIEFFLLRFLYIDIFQNSPLMVKAVLEMLSKIIC